MITGEFRDEHPRVVLAIGHSGTKLPVEFIVDTGFAGDLALPPHIASQIGLPFVSWRLRRLASGENRRLDVHVGTVEWNDEEREAEVLLLGGDPLMGTGLLEGMLLQIEGIEGGEVSIDPLD